MESFIRQRFKNLIHLFHSAFTVIKGFMKSYFLHHRIKFINEKIALSKKILTRKVLIVLHETCAWRLRRCVTGEIVSKITLIIFIVSSELVEWLLFDRNIEKILLQSYSTLANTMLLSTKVNMRNEKVYLVERGQHLLVFYS